MLFDEKLLLVNKFFYMIKQKPQKVGIKKMALKTPG